jgi:hypothetical protein
MWNSDINGVEVDEHVLERAWGLSVFRAAVYAVFATPTVYRHSFLGIDSYAYFDALVWLVLGIFLVRKSRAATVMASSISPQYPLLDSLTFSALPGQPIPMALHVPTYSRLPS